LEESPFIGEDDEQQEEDDRENRMSYINQLQVVREDAEGNVKCKKYRKTKARIVEDASTSNLEATA
jgi:hypothetical protein